MGQVHSRCSSGKQLLAACHDGDNTVARQILLQAPEASCYSTCMEKQTPLLVAAGRGHARMVQAILEAAVLSQGLTRAKKRCINHSNSKGQSALMLACMSGHAQCVEVLVCNGASPLVLDNARHNSALHWAASCCRADCVGRLLGSGAIFQMQSEQLIAIADIPCFDEDNSTLVKFVDRHNGWGLTALHLATFKGSSSTVRALLRHGAALSARTTAPSLSISPVLQPPGSTALHFAAAAEELSLVLVLLEAQASRNEGDLRRATNANGDRPLDLVRPGANPLLQQLLDPSNALSLHPGARSGIVLNPGSNLSRVITRDGLRQHQALLGLGTGAAARAGRRNASEQPPHIVLGGLLQRLKLVLSLEAFALQQQLAGAATGSSNAAAEAATLSSLLAKQQQVKEQALLAAAAGGDSSGDDVIGTAPAGADVAVVSRVARGTPAPAAGVDAAGHPRGPSTASSVLSSSSMPQEISPLSSSGEGADGDDTSTTNDAQQQQQQQQAQQVAAHQVRLKKLQQLLTNVDDILAMLPASATAAAGSETSSPRGGRSTTQQQQDRTGGRSSGSTAAGNGSWGLLGGLLARSSAGHLSAEDGDQQQQQQDPQQQQRAFGRSRGNRDSNGSDSSPAATPVPEEVVGAYITSSMLSSLAAVIKLFVGASSLSREPQVQGSSSWGSDARWAEQEHALGLMGGILKTARNSLEAGQQAAAAAACRSALRQRHQQQLATLLGPDRPVTSHSLRRALLGERLTDQGRMRFGASSTSSGRHDGSSLTAAHDGGMGMAWGVEALPGFAVGVPHSLPSRHGSRHRQQRGERSRRSRRGGEDGSSGQDTGGQEGSSRRHHRHHSRHHRSGRRRTPRAVDLPMLEVPQTPNPALATDFVTSGHQQGTGGSSSSAADMPQQQQQQQHAGGNPVMPSAADAAAAAEQEQQEHLRHLTSTLQQQQPRETPASQIQAGPSAAGSGGAQEPCQSTAAGAAADIEESSAAAMAARLHSGSSTSSSGTSRSSSMSGGEHHAATAAAAAAAVDELGCEDSDSEQMAGAASSCSSLDATTCAICMDCTAGVSVSRCSHSLCLQCAYQLCYKAKGLPLCPFCRQPIDGFDAAAVPAADAS